MRTGVRIFVSLFYLLGWVAHVYFGIWKPEIYTALGDTALIPGYTGLWENVVMPNITAFAMVLAAFEIGVGVMLVGKGKWVKVGLIFSMAFNLFLVQMGLGYPAGSGMESFLVNRLPNLIYMAIQVPLLVWGWDRRSVGEMVRGVA